MLKLILLDNNNNINSRTHSLSVTAKSYVLNVNFFIFDVKKAICHFFPRKLEKKMILIVSVSMLIHRIWPLDTMVHDLFRLGPYFKHNRIKAVNHNHWQLFHTPDCTPNAPSIALASLSLPAFTQSSERDDRCKVQSPWWLYHRQYRYASARTSAFLSFMISQWTVRAEW